MPQTSLNHRVTHGNNGILIHDAATLAYLFYPETLLLRRALVHVETRGQWARGQTLFDGRHSAKSKANLRKKDIDFALDFDSVRERRSSLGTGAMIVMSEGTGIVKRVTDLLCTLLVRPMPAVQNRHASTVAAASEERC